MKKILLVAIISLCASTVRSQLFDAHWIAYPQPDSTSQIWFRRQLILKDRPTRAVVTIITTGRLMLYINRRNVSTAVWMPDRTVAGHLPVSITLDITRFLHCDTNDIAIWYAPSCPHIDRQQVAFGMEADLKDGSKVMLRSDKNWLARRANIALTADGGERQDANGYCMNWLAEDIDWAMWQSAAETEAPPQPAQHYSAFYPAERQSRIFTPRYFDVAGDSVYYQFDKTFRGQIRVTLRDTKPGQRIYIGGLEYICSGKQDEQACRKFTVADNRRVLIYGDKNFRNKQIQTVEGIEIVPYTHTSYQY